LGAGIPEQRAQNEWIEGVAIWVAVLIVSSVGKALILSLDILLLLSFIEILTGSKCIDAVCIVQTMLRGLGVVPIVTESLKHLDSHSLFVVEPAYLIHTLCLYLSQPI
jgi:hypothetical protein